jgi:hypothetical protein
MLHSPRVAFGQAQHRYRLAAQIHRPLTLEEVKEKAARTRQQLELPPA